MIFEALQSELFRFKFHSLGSRILKFPEFNLLMIIFSEEYNVAVYITNQMTADPGAGMSFVADPKKPVGGHILAHASATRIMVSRSNLIPPVDLRMFKWYFSWRKAELIIEWPRYMIRQKCQKTKRPFLSEMTVSIIANPRPVLILFWN